jgi:hypothetical protein
MMAIVRMSELEIQDQRDAQLMARQDAEARFNMSLTEWELRQEFAIDEGADPLDIMLAEEDASIW